MNHPEDTCDLCGNPNPYWKSDNILFNEVNGSPNGILCPSCFAIKAKEKRISVYFQANRSDSWSFDYSMSVVIWNNAKNMTQEEFSRWLLKINMEKKEKLADIIRDYSFWLDRRMACTILDNSFIQLSKKYLKEKSKNKKCNYEFRANTYQRKLL